VSKTVKQLSLGFIILATTFYAVLFLMGYRLLSQERAVAAAPDGNDGFILAHLDNQAQTTIPSPIDYHTTIVFLQKTAQDDSSAIIQHEAVIALGKIGDTARAALEELLSSGSWLIRAEAAAQLGHLQLSASIPNLVKSLQDDPDPWVKYKAGIALLRFGDEAPLQLQTHLFDTDDQDLRLLGSQLLAFWRSPQAKANLLELMQDDNYTIRREAARAAASWNDIEVVRGLSKLLDDQRSDVRITARWALQGQAEIARTYALEQLEVEGWRNRVAAATILGEVGNEDERTILNERLDDERSRSVRASIRQARREIANRINEGTPINNTSVTEQVPIIPNEFYLVVDCNINLMYLVRGGRTLRFFPVATGSNRRMGRYFFHTPLGEFEILRKVEDPLWVRPAWAWIERGQEVPTDSRERWRGIPGVMGKYKMEIGNGYAIHGTNRPSSLGRHATHGCIRVGSVDLAAIYPIIGIGSKVYIF